MDERSKEGIDNQDISEACKRYEIEVESAKLIRSNTNYIFDCGDKFLRLTPSEIRNEKAIKAELAWIEYLRKNDLRVVEVVNSRHGHNYELIGLKNQVIAVCFQKIEGEKISKERWNAQHFRNLGELLGKMHKLSRKYRPGKGIIYNHWNEIDEHHIVDYLPKDDRQLSKLYDAVIAEITTYDRNKFNYGVIHYDVHHGNYFLSGDDIVLFDFEITCKSWFASDIATVLYYTLHTKRGKEEEDFEDEFMKWFWQGYESITRIEEEEKSHIPCFLLYRDLMVYGYLHKVWNIDALNKQQEDYLSMVEESIKLRRRVIE